MSNTELIAESRSYADSLRVVMQDQAAETIESLCDALQALCAKLDKATAAIKSISNDNWPDADLNAGEYANLVLHELAAGAVDKPAASEVISESSREAATSTDVLDGGCHEHGNWNGRCCCNCRWHIEDFYHCTTYKGPASQCMCSTHKGWICMPPDFGGAHSDWTEHGMCEMHEPKPSNAGAEPREASASGNLLYDTRKNT